MVYSPLIADGIPPMPIEIDSIVRSIAWFHRNYPIVGLFFITSGADILFGLFAACKTKTLSSTISQSGMIRKAIQILWVGLAGSLEPYSGGMPMSGMVAMCFIITNMISITENSARGGVPVPKPILELLIRLRNNEKAAVPLPVQSTVNIQRASNVDIHTTEPAADGSIHADQADVSKGSGIIITKQRDDSGGKA